MKFRKFLRTVPMKLYIIFAAIVIFAFFSNDFGLVDIQKTAIILAAGIDKTENGVLMTVQIAVPKGSDRTTGGTSSVEIDAEGKTVSECVAGIYSETGWVPKFVFCDLILIGEEAAKEDVISYLNYFLRSEYQPDSCLLAVCKGTAKDILTSQSAIDDASSLAIEKLFSDAAQKSGRVMVNTLKDFTIGYFGVSKSGYLPYLRSHSEDGGQSAGGGGKSSGGGEEDKEQKVYTAHETALFYEGRMVGLLPPEQTQAFCMLQGKVFAGTFNAKEKGDPITLTVIKNSGGVSLDMKEGPKAKLSVELLVRLCCRSTGAGIEDISSDVANPETLESAAATIEEFLKKLWEITQESGCDLFYLKRTLYRSSLKKYAAWKDSLLSSVQPDFKVKVISMK